jgi:hypothetical protein
MPQKQLFANRHQMRVNALMQRRDMIGTAIPAMSKDMPKPTFSVIQRCAERASYRSLETVSRGHISYPQRRCTIATVARLRAEKYNHCVIIYNNLC